jgi:hypothetical protein
VRVGGRVALLREETDLALSDAWRVTFDVDACAQECTRADASAVACIMLVRTNGCVRARAVDERDASCEARSVVCLGRFYASTRALRFYNRVY